MEAAYTTDHSVIYIALPRQGIKRLCAPAVFSTNDIILNNKLDYIKSSFNCQLVKFII
jgi:hypothetical protein